MPGMRSWLSITAIFFLLLAGGTGCRINFNPFQFPPKFESPIASPQSAKPIYVPRAILFQPAGG
jgi:hypothetical protein